ncbi:MAG: hypothetical protein QM770_05200 [Tepidisphaeraceae bacterium]
MSYVRELRPYMYWLGYLTSGRQAGELDWQAIGGTWGCATSNLTRWTMPSKLPFPLPPDLHRVVEQVGKISDTFARYILRYFADMAFHINGLRSQLARGASLHYIVGNSKFYDTLLPVEVIFREMFEAAGFAHCDIRTLRKRTSKKELFEFDVMAVWQ